MAPETVQGLAALYLGALARSGRPESPPIRPVPGFPRGLARRLDVATRIEKAMVVVAFPTSDLWDIGRTRRLNLLADIFSEKLRDVVREKLGAAYSPYAYNRPSRAYPGHGLLQALVTVAPDQAAMVRDRVLAIADELAAGRIEADTLIRAKEPSLTRIRDSLRQNTYWLQTVLTGCRDYPQQLDWARSILADYRSVTADQLAQLAAKYLDTVNSASLLILPKAGPPSD
jgi:zinc protease